jgi:RNA polymerase sigma factor (sigma-70 family)
LAYLYRLLGGRQHMAEDLVQESFLRLLQHGGYQQGRPFKPWLYAIATNLARDSFKSASARRQVGGEDEDWHSLSESAPGPEELALAAEEGQRIAAAIGQLRVEYRSALLLRDMAVRRVDEVLEMVNLEREADRKLRGYSGGMKQRVGIAQALLNDPELLIVDEPTAGLDPEERVRFRTLLATFTVNRLIILSTHIISDVEAAASRLLLLREGKLLADTTPEDLLSNAVGKVWSVTTDTATALDLQARYQVSGMVSQRVGVNLRILSVTQPVEIAELVEPTLEDAYLVASGTKIAAQ